MNRSLLSNAQAFKLHACARQLQRSESDAATGFAFTHRIEIKVRPLHTYGHIITVIADQQKHSSSLADYRRHRFVRGAHGLAL